MRRATVWRANASKISILNEIGMFPVKRIRDLMEILAKRIKEEFGRKAGERAHCAVYEDELQRIWPIDEKDREKKIAHFARDYGFQTGFYKPGLCAIFLKQPPKVGRA